MKNKRNRKAKRLRTKGLGRPVNKTPRTLERIKLGFETAFFAVLAVVALALLGELVALGGTALLAYPELYSFMVAVKNGVDAAGVITSVIGVAAVMRAITKGR